MASVDKSNAYTGCLVFIRISVSANMIETIIKNVNLKFETSEKVFSPNAIDSGTLAMIEMIEFKAEDKVLDLGCGYGVVGILAAKTACPENVYMCDIFDEAVSLSKINSKINGVENVNIFQSDGFKNITEKDFTIIASNPPYHEDFKVPKLFIENGYKALATGGKMYMVTKRRTWYKNKFISVFGGVNITELNGYFIFISEKKLKVKINVIKNQNIPSKKLAKRIKVSKTNKKS